MIIIDGRKDCRMFSFFLEARVPRWCERIVMALDAWIGPTGPQDRWMEVTAISGSLHFHWRASAQAARAVKRSSFRYELSPALSSRKVVPPQQQLPGNIGKARSECQLRRGLRGMESLKTSNFHEQMQMRSDEEIAAGMRIPDCLQYVLSNASADAEMRSTDLT